MLAWFLYGCKTDRKTKELVSLFATWVASYMLNSLVAYADQIETKGRRISYPEIFACLPEQFNSQQVREALIANGSTARLDRVVATWINRNQIVEKVAHGSYRKMKHDK